MFKIIEDMHKTYPEINGWILSHEYPDYMQYKKKNISITFAPCDEEDNEWDDEKVSLSIQVYECQNEEVGDWDTNEDCHEIEDFELTVDNLHRTLLPFIEKYDEKLNK